MPAGYVLYGGGAADFVADVAAGTGAQPLVSAPNATLTIYTDNLPGGTTVTDLLDLAENPQTSVTTDTFGNFRFWAPENSGTLWATTGDSTATRYAVQPAALGDDILGIEESVAGLVSDALATGDPAPQYVLRGGTGSWRIWPRTAAEGLPTAGDGAVDGDYCFFDA